MTVLDKVKAIVGEALLLGKKTRSMTRVTPLHGAIPELDSVAVVAIIAALEQQFDITVVDTEIGAEVFATLGSLSAFVERKLGR